MDNIEKLIEVLKLKGYSYKTIKSYKSNIAGYINSGCHSTKEYILRLINTTNYRESTINQIINSINFYNKHVLMNNNKYKQSFLKSERQLPQILTVNEVKQLLNSITNIKHKTIFSLVYSSGLRVGEVVVLKLEHIDFERNLLLIRRAKGKKDRYTLLQTSPKVFEKLCFSGHI